MSSTRVLIVAAAPAGIELRSMLEADDEHDFEIEVAGEASSPDLAAGLAESDVFLLADEDSLEEMDFTLLEDGTQSAVVLSADEAPVARLRGMPLSGWGIVTPDAPPEEISAAIHAVARGLVVLPETLAERLLGAPAAAVDEPSEPLTSREREVLELLGRGLSNRLIAGELHISEHTVKFHVSSVYAKLGVGTRAGAVSQGARRGLISL
ncbi:MAG TPA: response regulator transcription factor [Rubrobacteraceae bacterium]|nr:response regulator transcription factor [Rubrobacteraceae bacterium]